MADTVFMLQLNFDHKVDLYVHKKAKFSLLLLIPFAIGTFYTRL